MSDDERRFITFDPDDDPDKAGLTPKRKRLAWLLILGGVATILGGAALGMTVSAGFAVLSVLGGLAFAVGLVVLAQHAALLLFTLFIGIAAPLVLTFGGHRVLMDQFGHVESCVVSNSNDARNRSGPRRSYVLRCPSGLFRVTLSGSTPITAEKPGVKYGPPLRPIYDEPSGWDPLIIVIALGLMTGSVFIARAMGRRKQ